MTETGCILLVEDDPVIGGLCHMLLRSAGHTVHRADTAAEARAIIKENAALFDLAVIDIGLPDMPGDELARQLPPIPVVCISGTKTRVDELEKDRGAVTRFLKKPFAFPAFLDLVAKLVQAPESQ